MYENAKVRIGYSKLRESNQSCDDSVTLGKSSHTTGETRSLFGLPRLGFLFFIVFHLSTKIVVYYQAHSAMA